MTISRCIALIVCWGSVVVGSQVKVLDDQDNLELRQVPSRVVSGIALDAQHERDQKLGLNDFLCDSEEEDASVAEYVEVDTEEEKYFLHDDQVELELLDKKRQKIEAFLSRTR